MEIAGGNGMQAIMETLFDAVYLFGILRIALILYTGRVICGCRADDRHVDDT